MARHGGAYAVALHRSAWRVIPYQPRTGGRPCIQLQLQLRRRETASAVANETVALHKKPWYHYVPMTATRASFYFWYYFPKPLAEEGLRSP